MRTFLPVPKRQFLPTFPVVALNFPRTFPFFHFKLFHFHPMPFVSVTRLHLASRWSFPRFVFYALSSSKQARRSRGFLTGWVSNDGKLGLWTVTVWESLEAMRAFRNSGVHMKAMPKLLGWCDEASFVHWEQREAGAPGIDAAFDRLSREGKLSKVNNPSARHRAGHAVSDARPLTTQQLKKIDA